MNNSISKKKVCLKVIEGSSQSNGIFLREGEMLIGRKSSNDIVIKDHEVDKEHASIKNYQGKVEIIGLGSKSKIFVNGEQLEFRTLYTLKRNDMIKMGHSTFQYIPAEEYENYIDPLLIIYNTAYLRKSLENEFKNSKKLSLSLLFFDLDQFETTNEYTNEAANYVLMELSKLIQNKYVRDKDTFARYGDANEFAILLIDTNVESAYEIANEIRCFVETYPFIFEEKKLPSITLNIGISEVNSSVKSSKDLLNHAKEACKRAKEYGRNQIVIWENDQISIQKVYLGFLNFFLYSKFAKSGNHWDENNLGKCYRDGIGTKKNVQKAFHWFEKSAKGGNHLGQCNLGHCYRDEIRIQKNQLESLRWYMKSAEDGNRSAQIILTNLFQEGVNGINEDIFQFVDKSAKDENHLGQGLLASCFLYGIKVGQDYEKAFHWAKKSAQGGNTLGQNILGICYQNGYGVEKDDTKAFKWYERSAQGGDTKGQYNLGSCYQNGIGVEKDDKKASFWFKKSAQDGSINTQCKLSIIDIIHVISDIFSIMLEMFGSFSKPILLFIVLFFFCFFYFLFS
ncbi:hypothetical protein C2G38_2079900 [Gigaspora rosea]|uniref:FHA domain-containing protein n=1 Tax=Gigaspora rosea TaxID=44941 RepID=A0A397VNM5_9GLOM|nr:hypothetical protein C2G38_2079900 [Gigaspora rosea]